MTVQAFAQWLTELKGRSSRTLQEMLSEMSIIRDGITSNNMELTDFKRHSTGISQQMQAQLTDLREKLTNAFGEITALVKQKTQSDQEMMQDINSLQDNLSCKTSELEALKRSYSQAHTQLQSSLIQIQNHLQVTNSEVQTAKGSCERVQRDTAQRFTEIDGSLRSLEDELSVGNAEHRSQMLQLQEEIARIHESLTSLNAEFLDHKRATNSINNKLQSQVWNLEEQRKRQPYTEHQGMPQSGSYQPDSTVALEPTAYGVRPMGVQQAAGTQPSPLQHTVAGAALRPSPGSVTVAPHPTVIASPLQARGAVVMPGSALSQVDTELCDAAR
eukprot:CAMPEP_0171069004 /NCGR_PEP_ID=MMETSP0766_2-20121228/8891_1 /TAXON_ID=439317 /ORGANISM="Gambierdiscus australes, Strain CAWD 149" /LENGTH=329 /DNA_ID=CAMNT_0011525357 /DNA_START=103 /DNA_END=1089 /DNA_ORIENTATION=-